ncbi:hypothetical protein [Microcoleus sp. FACHB-672]|uniref:hypothetical protein n=1 Tax=Microcoleus sp. FACHB-672 TaxID=2692825 RepID=UPI0016832852|nr:hypothetical protein [Microcoleus sp. FACHB-672]MBD2039424.1 hypothetical protein [Microcoleus sp. FACHB-672]
MAHLKPQAAAFRQFLIDLRLDGAAVTSPMAIDITAKSADYGLAVGFLVVK